MHKIFLIIFVLMFSDFCFSQGDAPALLKGQAQSSSSVGSFIQVPNSQITKIGSASALIETGNTNILANPSFEHSTVLTGWTSSGTGSNATDTTNEIAGLKAVAVTTSAQTIDISQSSTLYASQFADGVQGLAMMRVKSNHSGVCSVCSIQAGTVSTTNCATVSNNNKWGIYKVPFILGATSNGVSLACLSGTGTTIIDDAFVGAVDLKADIDSSRIAGESYFAGTAACTGWTRTSTTVGAVATDADCPGPTVVYSSMGSWQTTDSDLPRQTINNLPPGVYKATFTVWPYTGAPNRPVMAINDGTTTCEPIQVNQSATTATSQDITCTFTYTSAGNRVFELYVASATSSVIIDNSQASAPRASVKFRLEYFNSGSIYTASCGANCVDTFSAKVTDGSGTTTVSQENVEWINGNCTNPSAGTYVCTFASGVFSVAPNCEAVIDDVRIPRVSSTSTTATVSSYDAAGAATDGNSFSLMCQKQGVDFVATRNIIGSFNEVMTAPGITKPKTCYYAFGGASATLASPTVCSTGTCVETYDSCGVGTPPAYGGSAGIYTNFTLANGTFSNSSFIHCTCAAWDTSTGNARDCVPYWETGDQSWQTTSSGGYVTNLFSSNAAGTASNTYVQVKCEGQAP